MPHDGNRVAIDWGGRSIEIEFAWVGVHKPKAPIMVFLHEGIGSVALWKDFPAKLCELIGIRGLVYSRPGYGQSTSRSADERWGVDFMHRQGFEVLPAILAALQIDQRQDTWLFGHSDGGSISLLYAIQFSDALAGVMVMAPHIFVEDISVVSIEQIRQVYLDTDLRDKLGRYHREPDSAFWGWNDVWLDPAFRHWNIEAEIQSIRCPVLAIQGIDDEYGTLAQIRGIAQRVARCELLELPECGHSPHRDQPEAVLAAVTRFMSTHGNVSA